MPLPAGLATTTVTGRLTNLDGTSPSESEPGL